MSNLDIERHNEQMTINRQYRTDNILLNIAAIITVVTLINLILQ